MFDHEEPCDCGGKFRFTSDDVAKGRTMRCSRRCDAELQLRDGGGAAGAAKAERDLDTALKGLSRTIKFKL